MEQEKIKELIATLKRRAQDRQNVTETRGNLAAKGIFSANHFESAAVNRAHIEEIEFVIEKLDAMLASLSSDTGSTPPR